MLRNRTLFCLISLAAVAALVLVACENRGGDPTTIFSLGGGSTVVGVTPTPTASAPPTSPPTFTPQPGPVGGEATVVPAPSDGSGGGAAGSGLEVFLSTGCVACHTVGSVQGAVGEVGPNLSTVASLAGSRVEGLSAEGYLRQSIEDPGAFLVEGFGPLMPGGLATGDDLDNLVAFLLTLK